MGRLTEAEQLFLDTVGDLRKRIESGDPYETLMGSALIRKLLLDRSPLLQQANQEHRIKIRFRISDPNTPYRRIVMADKPVFWSLQDGLDPETKLTAGGSVDATRDQFLAATVLMHEQKPFSVRDIVDFEANIMGGVHLGSPKDEKDRVLVEISGLYKIDGIEAARRQLQSIGRVILRAVEPLEASINAKRE